MFESGLWETEIIKCHEFYKALLSVEAKYAVKCAIHFFQFFGKLRKRKGCLSENIKCDL